MLLRKNRKTDLNQPLSPPIFLPLAQWHKTQNFSTENIIVKASSDSKIQIKVQNASQFRSV